MVETVTRSEMKRRSSRVLRRICIGGRERERRSIISVRREEDRWVDVETGRFVR